MSTDPTYVQADTYVEMFGELCTWFWYHDHPGYPRDKFQHTSKECRAFAVTILGLLGIVSYGSASEPND